MKMKSMVLAAATLTLFSAPHAKALCTDFEIAGAIDIVVGVITSAPLLTTTAFMPCRDEMLNLQEAAVAYRMSGEMSPVLRSSIDAVQKEQNLSAETIIDRLLNAKLGAE